MEILQVGKARFSAEVVRCMGCKQTEETCKISKFVKLAESIEHAGELGAVAESAGLRQAVRYANVIAEGTETHYVYLCDRLAFDLNLARINITTETEPAKKV